MAICILSFTIQPLQATENTSSVTTTTATDSTKEKTPTIAAESAILIDANSKTVLYEKNGYNKQYPASITKLMTALLAIENLNPNDTITFSHDAIFSIERGSSHIGLDVGEQITVDQALHGLLLMSANEVANGLAEAVSGSIENFANCMTLRAKELGAKNTNFANPHGLHDPNHYTTAYDMALIGSYLAYNDYFLDIMKDTTYQIPPTNLVNEIRYLYQQHSMVNPTKNPIYYRKDVIGGKTGFTDEAHHTLVTMARRGDTTLVAVVLKSKKATLYTDTAALLDYGFDSYDILPLHKTTDMLATLPLYSVKSGKNYQAGNCSIGLAEDSNVLVHKSVTASDITTKLRLPEYITLGNQIGDEVGEITYLYGSEILCVQKLIITDIAFSPSPFTTETPTSGSILSNIWYIALGILTLFCLILFILWLNKKYLKRKKPRIFDK